MKIKTLVAMMALAGITAVAGQVAENLKPTKTMQVAMVGIGCPHRGGSPIFPYCSHADCSGHVPQFWKFRRAGVGDVLKITVWEASETGLFAGRDRKGGDIDVRVPLSSGLHPVSPDCR